MYILYVYHVYTYNTSMRMCMYIDKCSAEGLRGLLEGLDLGLALMDAVLSSEEIVADIINK